MELKETVLVYVLALSSYSLLDLNNATITIMLSLVFPVVKLKEIGLVKLFYSYLPYWVACLLLAT